MAVELTEPKLRVRDERAIRKALLDVKQGHPDKLLTAEATVEAARDEESPLHSQFEWDDTEAAQHYRLAQARALIRRIIVTMPDDETESAVPKYVSLRSDRKRKGGGYRETAEVLNNAELLTELEQTAKRDIDGVLHRYEMLKALCARVRKAAGIRPKENGRAASRPAPRKG